jgi:hypothetical protein
MTHGMDRIDSKQSLAILLREYSTEVLAGDRASIEVARTMMQPGAEVFIASRPSGTSDSQIKAASELRHAALSPVPHIVARNIKNLAELDSGPASRRSLLTYALMCGVGASVRALRERPLAAHNMLAQL